MCIVRDALVSLGVGDGWVFISRCSSMREGTLIILAVEVRDGPFMPCQRCRVASRNTYTYVTSVKLPQNPIAAYTEELHLEALQTPQCAAAQNIAQGYKETGRANAQQLPRVGVSPWPHALRPVTRRRARQGHAACSSATHTRRFDISATDGRELLDGCGVGTCRPPRVRRPIIPSLAWW